MGRMTLDHFVDFVDAYDGIAGLIKFSAYRQRNTISVSLASSLRARPIVFPAFFDAKFESIAAGLEH